MVFARLNRPLLSTCISRSILSVILGATAWDSVSGQDPAARSSSSLASSIAEHVDPLTLTPTHRSVWQTSETANFRVQCVGTAREARTIAEACESVRELLHATWLGDTELPTWTAKCEVVLHPTAAEYHACLGRGSEQSAGCSTIDIDGQQVVKRRIDICATTVSRVAEVLPHEMTHVVLADRFISSPVPRWAAEGMSILAEPCEKQQLRSAVVQSEHVSRSPIRVQGLLRADDYPAVDFRGSFYAHSAILVRFLAERESPQDVVRFLERAERDGYEVALRDIYQIEGVAHLDRIWRTGGERGRSAATNASAHPVQPIALHVSGR